MEGRKEGRKAAEGGGRRGEKEQEIEGRLTQELKQSTGKGGMEPVAKGGRGRERGMETTSEKRRESK